MTEKCVTILTSALIFGLAITLIPFLWSSIKFALFFSEAPPYLWIFISGFIFYLIVYAIHDYFSREQEHEVRIEGVPVGIPQDEVPTPGVSWRRHKNLMEHHMIIHKPQRKLLSFQTSTSKEKLTPTDSKGLIISDSDYKKMMKSYPNPTIPCSYNIPEAISTPSGIYHASESATGSTRENIEFKKALHDLEIIRQRHMEQGQSRSRRRHSRSSRSNFNHYCTCPLSCNENDKHDDNIHDDDDVHCLKIQRAPPLKLSVGRRIRHIGGSCRCKPLKTSPPNCCHEPKDTYETYERMYDYLYCINKSHCALPQHPIDIKGAEESICRCAFHQSKKNPCDGNDDMAQGAKTKTRESKTKPEVPVAGKHSSELKLVYTTKDNNYWDVHKFKIQDRNRRKKDLMADILHISNARIN